MRLFCWICGKSVSTELDKETVVRAVCICPECIGEKKVLFMEEKKRHEA